MAEIPAFTLNPELDVGALATSYARDGRVSIADFLGVDAALELAALLRSRMDWRQMVNSGEKVLELSRETRAAMSAEQHQALDDAIYAAARTGFQFRYESIRVPDDAAERRGSRDPLCAFAAWLSQDPVRALFRSIIGDQSIDFADAQATAYSPGDFLTGHDDDVKGKGRRAAYVLGLTQQWRAEWGGLLMFHDGASLIDARVPQFNSVNLFRVPQLHSVSQVTRAAAFRRYSITGWLRRAR